MTAPDLGSGSLGSEGSTPFARTIFNPIFVLYVIIMVGKWGKVVVGNIILPPLKVSRSSAFYF